MRFRLLLLSFCALPCGAELPTDWVSRSVWGSQPLPLSDTYLHKPARIVLHHAGVLWKSGDDPIRKLRGLQSWGQREKNWPDLPYHFLIAPDGRVFEGRELRYRPESNTDYDLSGVVNVHLWGNFDEQRVNQRQLAATREVLRWLNEEHGLTVLRTHQQEAPGQTTCPGADLARYLPALQQGTAELLPALPGGPQGWIEP